MSRSPLPLVLALSAVSLVAVPAAFAKDRDHPAARIQGVCTQQSTSTLKLGREDRGIEVEVEIDQNRNGVPWRVVLSRNGRAVASFTARTHGPSGSFEVRRVVAGRLGTDRISAVATRSGETCTTGGVSRAKAAASVGAPSNDDAGDDHGHHSRGHS